ncbi:MAG: corrinoid protein-associated methyltransferase CpaM [Candidatus Heimdallarchaeaceae archaeon]
MKILEKKPKYYDKLIHLLSLSNLSKIYSEITEHVKKGDKVLDICCGTGKLTFLAAERGAFVKGIDINPSMLDIARKKAKEKKLNKTVWFEERSVIELDEEKENSYDIIMGALCLSELSKEERAYTIKQIGRILKPNGKLLLVYEKRPSNIFKYLIYFLLRLPLLILTVVLVQKTTRGLNKKDERIIFTQKFEILIEKENWLGSLKQLVLKKRDLNENN